MVVRFLPTAEVAPAPPANDRGDLAEVIDLRSRLSRGAARQNAEEQLATEASHTSGGVDEAHGLEAPLARERSLPDTSRTASDDAVRLLARRARSSGELRRELSRLGHAFADIEAVVLECEGSLYLDDLGLARVLTEGLRERKRASRTQIRVKLRERLLPDWAIEEALGELDEDEEQVLLREAAVDRACKLKGLDRTTAERRLLGFLARRGWSGERATRVAREALDNAVARGTVRFH
jgi:regulatory protein